MHQRDGGVFRFRGEDVDFGSTAEAKAAGIAVIYQEPTLFPDLSVTENIFMGRQPPGPRPPDRPRRHVRRGRASSSHRLGVAIDPRRPARGLSIADQQIIEIAKAISLDAAVLIMDEPTAALSGVEVERLFAVARSLRDEGRAVVFISHRFDEVFALCDTVTVMRDGEYVATDADRRHRRRPDRRPDGRPRGRRPVPQDRRPRSATSVLEVSGLTSAGTFHDVSFTSAPARSSASPGSSAPAAARSPAPSSASTATTPARSAWPAARVPPARPARRDAARAWRSCPRTDASRAWSRTRSVARNIAGVIRGRLTRAGLLTSGDENRAAGPGPPGSR